MARMYPDPMPAYIREDPLRSTECRVYDALKQELDDSYRVFYSRPWLGLAPDGREIEGETDFTVGHPERGLLTLEVKGGVVARNGQTDEWTSRDRWGALHRIKDPVKQARSGKYQLLTRLVSHARWKPRFINIKYGVILPDSGRPKSDLGPDMPLALFAFTEDMPGLGQWVVERLTTAVDSRAEPLGADGIQALEQLLAASFDLVVKLGPEVAAADRQIIRITAEQFAALDGLETMPRVAVKGGAGTGKTVLAVEKARRLARDGRRTLLTCYNRALAGQLAAGCSGTPGLVVSSFHQLCVAFARACGRKLVLDQDAVDPDFFTIELPNALVDAVAENPELRFEAIVVDEAQDFLSGWWDALFLTLTNPEGDPFYYFFDDNQNVHHTPAELPAFPVFQLTRNLRNTRAIFKLAAHYYTGGVYRPGGPEGTRVEMLPVNSNSQLYEKVRNWVARMVFTERIPPQNIAILAPDRAMVRGICDHGLPGNLVPCGADSAEPTGLVVDTVRRFKGLEKPVVCLCGTENIAGDTDLAYVAMTRARVLLALAGTPQAIRAMNPE